MSDTMLSRSGRTGDSGKMSQRFDVPVTEDLNERGIIRASQKGKPKAEFLRDVLEMALVEGCWADLSDGAQRALNVLSALYEKSAGEYMLAMVETELRRRFAMLQSMAQEHHAAQLDESTTRLGANE